MKSINIEPIAFSRTGLLLLAVGIFILYRIVLVIYRIYFHPLSRFPGPKLYAFSSLPYSWEDKLQGTFGRRMISMHNQYGPIVRIAPDIISVDGGIAWPEVWLRRSDKPEFSKVPEMYPAQEKYVGILPSQTRENHRRQRRLLAHAFSEAAMYEQENYIKYYVDILMQQLRDRAARYEDVDLTEWYNFTTFDIIGELAFADSFHAVENGQYHPWIAMIFSGIRLGSTAAFLSRYPLLAPLVCVGMGISVKDLKKIISDVKQNIMLSNEKTRKRLAMTDTSRKDIMEYILQHNTDDNKGMTRDEIFENARALIGAGSETTATALSGLSYYLMRTPEVYQRLTQEIRTAFATEEEINMRAAAHLPYLQATVEECLRIYPPANETPPRVSPGDYINYNGEQVWIPKGARINNYQLATNRLPRYFADPDRFAPERWLPESHPWYDVRYANDNKAVSQPFAAGPRNCIGKNLAYAELRLVTARMLWNFDLELVDKHHEWAESQKTFGLWEKGPLKTRLHLRNLETVQDKGLL